MSGRNIFITGGTGKIGRILVDRLAGLGNGITLLTRKAHKSIFPSNVRVVQGDILDPKSYSHVLSGIDSILHLAAVTHTNSKESGAT